MLQPAINNTFIKRRYQEVRRSYSINYDKLLEYPITIIYGNAGTGKTFQLSKYYKKNTKKSLYISFFEFEKIREENIDKNIDVVILDSLDQLHIKYLKKDFDSILIEFIKKCKEINPEIKFIFSSRTHLVGEISENLALEFGYINTLDISYNFSHQEFKNVITHNVSVILGEPASGKTFQLKNYSKNNPNTHLVELVTIKYENEIKNTTEIVLLDSIDEALINHKSFKTLNAELINYIKACKKINPKVKFVISCRALEWKEYFAKALENIENDMKIYNIIALDIEDINQLLIAKKIFQEEFWEFIKENQIEAFLKNIMVLFHIVNKFTVYRSSSFSYIDIYKDIIKEHISKKGEDREDIIWDDPIDKYILIASSLATYMILNRVQYLELDNLPILADELYQINSFPVIASDIKKVLSTTLFETKGHRIDFYHKSIKEYLTANFIYKKNLDMIEVKALFSHNLRFYEEFEEIIIYLTNLNSNLF
ncbi:MAG: hypothetical protein ACJAWW_002494, partial [Sulfurimonas sp.]